MIIRQTKKSSIDKITPIGRNTCLILAFSGFPESPGSFASFTYERSENQGMGSHPKIHPPGLVGDFQAADSCHYATAKTDLNKTRVARFWRKENSIQTDCEFISPHSLQIANEKKLTRKPWLPPAMTSVAAGGLSSLVLLEQFSPKPLE